MKKIKSLFLYTLYLSIIFLFSCSFPGKTQQDTSKIEIVKTKDWWKEAIVYQIYPRSFKDDNGDGIGDLKGIISKLDYLKSLGINTIWLNPIYESPNFDNGYDVSDYYKISKQFGTMKDFDSLLKGLHSRGIKLVMDMVLNHSSDQNEWFKQSRSSRTNSYRNYYHWWPAEKGKPTPRWSFFDVNSDAWKYDSLTNSYYLHYFALQQPDLNWENPKVREEIYKMMRFWADKGVDGFRMDAFQYVSKDTTFPALPNGYDKNIDKYYGAGPHLHDYIREMNRNVLSKYNVLTVAEGAGATMQDAMKFVDSARHEFSMVYHFKGIGYGDYKPNYDLPGFKKVYSSWDSMFANKGWLSIYLSNHDQPRMVSHWGSEDPQFRELSSKMLTTFLMTMRGTPYFYYGDELGMVNIGFNKIEEYDDIAVKNKYLHLKQTGGDLKGYLEYLKRSARDNNRTPFQWDSSLNSGFTTGKPWLKVNPNYKIINATIQEKDPNSILNYFRKAVKLRNENKVLVYGKYTLVDASNPDVYAYTRIFKDKKILVLLNFKAKAANQNSGIDLSGAKLLLDNYSNPSTGKILKPYEAQVYEF
jgi:oligo-1,6-glucosidase